MLKQSIEHHANLSQNIDKLTNTIEKKVTLDEAQIDRSAGEGGQLPQAYWSVQHPGLSQDRGSQGYHHWRDALQKQVRAATNLLAAVLDTSAKID